MSHRTITREKASTASLCTPTERVMVGAMGGVVAGVVFGMMMNMLHMMGSIAMLVGSKSNVVGWATHIAISMVLGIAFSLLFEKRIQNLKTGLGYGIAYGMFWWVLGGLVLMPAKLKMPIFHFNTMAWQSLMGHVVFGMVLGALVVAIPSVMKKK